MKYFFENYYLCLLINNFIIRFCYRIKKQPRTAREGGGSNLENKYTSVSHLFKSLFSILSNYLLWLSYSSHQSHTPYTPGGKYSYNFNCVKWLHYQQLFWIK